LAAARAGGPGDPPQISENPVLLRVGHWNIEKGLAWERILDAFDTEPLRPVDQWSLNEVDIGMARSGNRNQIVELAGRLGYHWAFVPNYLELTKGPGPDAHAPGTNALGLHGVGLLSRWPLEEVHTADLHECFDYFRFAEEKRYGCRRLLFATVVHPRGCFVLATVHLEVRNTPACRLRQMAPALEAIPSGPCWLAGDWNTHTFRRGSVVRSAIELLRFLRTDPASMQASLLAPEGREPLLQRVRGAGFDLDPWNERVPTARQILARVEELDAVPGFLRGMLARTVRSRAPILRMRLDWIAARGPWRAAGPQAAWTGTALGPEGSAVSDHAPIGVVAAWTGNPVEPAAV
jgi:endonuclease/exonuclease/phosphatase family metal-dependent hydrolase